MQYYLTCRLLSGSLPETDRNIGYPYGVDVRRTFSVGAEYMYRWLLPLVPKRPGLETRLRIIQVSWFCLGILGMGVLARVIAGARSHLAALTAAAFYAFSPASVVRSSGIELSRENWALPLIVWHLVLLVVCLRSKSRRRILLFAGVASLISAAALILWDLTQYYLALVAVAGWLGLAVGAIERAKFTLLSLVHLVILLITCRVNPYLASHGVIAGPAVILLVAGGAYGATRWVLRTSDPRLAWGAAVAVALGVVLVIWGSTGGEFSDSYGHFGGLLWAKIRYLNRKPLDPSGLTFEQRIMWTPALNSATWRLTWRLFPGMLVVSVVAAARFLWRREGAVELIPWLFFYSVALATYCLFVRFHAYAAIFGSVLAGVLLHSLSPAKGWGWRSVKWLVVMAVVWEAWLSVARAGEWGRPEIYYREISELCDWLERNGRGDGVLANFGVSGSILAYGKCPVVLYPKFESPEIRRAVRKYGETVFRGRDEDLRRLVDTWRVGWLVWCRGEFSAVHPEWQMRYMVDALQPDKEAPARWLEYSEGGKRYFPLVWENRKYRIFRAIGFAAEREGAQLAEEAWELLRSGRLEEAEGRAWEALAKDMHCESAMQVIHHVTSLREEGFSYPAAGDGDW